MAYGWGWTHHPGVRSGDELTFGERAADVMRNSFGSWGFLASALAFIGCWIVAVDLGVSIDNGQLTILNLVLSCFAAIQGSIILLAAKRADQQSAELARHGFQVDLDDAAVNTEALALLHQLAADHAKLHERLTSISAQVALNGPGGK